MDFPLPRLPKYLPITIEQPVELPKPKKFIINQPTTC